ncbi:MAG: hypothetical protein WD512_11785, partial [Candidatus Paceibacterota bacterium]
MWNLLGNDYRHYISAHKHAEITWNDQEIGSESIGNQIPVPNDKILSVEYSSKWKQTSAGFRAEIYLEPNTTYQLEIKAKLIAGDMAFVYVESLSERLIPRFKIYQNTQSYKLKHNFITPNLTTTKDKNLSVYLGILFFYPEQNYLLEVTQFVLRRISKLTENNLILHQAAYDPSILPSEDMLKSTGPLGSRLTPDKQLISSGPAREKVASSFPLIDLSEISRNTSSKTGINNGGGGINNGGGRINNGGGGINKKNSSDYYDIDLMSDWVTSPKISYSNESNYQGGDQVTLPPENEDLVKILRLPGEVDETLPSPNSIPMEVTKSHISLLSSRMKELGMNISISLTTIPTRLGKLDKVMESLCDQSIPIKTIYLVIPHKYKRADLPYMITKKWYFHSAKIRIIRTPDVGPMTKLVQVLDHLGSRDLLLTADDDHIYPKHWAYFLSYLTISNPNYKAIWGFKGNLNGKYKMSHGIDYPINVDWLSGSLGVAYPIKYIKDPAAMLKQVNFAPEAFYTDDLLIGNHMAYHKINRVVIPSVADNIQDQVYPKPTEWSNSRDSLHRMIPAQSTRYLTVIDALKKRKQYFLDRKGFIPASFKSLDSPNNDALAVGGVGEGVGGIATISMDKLGDSRNVGSSMGSITPNGRLIRTKFSKFDPNVLSKKRIRYISYQTCYLHIDWVLLYLRAVSNVAKKVTLEMPNFRKESGISLPSEYARWFGEDYSNFDIIIIDIPFCLETGIQVKANVPVYYIYRYPEIGNANCIFNKTPQPRNDKVASGIALVDSNVNLIINTYYHSTH